jgi:nuclear transport factor 2 (NTF2) superfamily protein
MPRWFDYSITWLNMKLKGKAASGNEFWEFNADGLIEQRIARIYDVPIDEAKRKFR